MCDDEDLANTVHSTQAKAAGRVLGRGPCRPFPGRQRADQGAGLFWTWMPTCLLFLLTQAGPAARGRPRRGLPVTASHRLHPQEPAVHQCLGLADTQRAALLSPCPLPTHRPLQSLSDPGFSTTSLFLCLRLDCSPHWLTLPPQCGGGACEEPWHSPFHSHLWTNFPVVSGLGVGKGTGWEVGEVQPLEMYWRPSPSML